MLVYITFLRGINVGSKNMVKMDALKLMFEELGLERVQTYIRSGNVLFLSDEPENCLQERIEEGFEKVFGFPAQIILRTLDELEKLLGSLPFTEAEISEAEAKTGPEVECLYVALLPQAPGKTDLDKIGRYRNAGDEYRLIGRDMYLLFHHSIRDSKLANNLQKLGVPATVRNWNTLGRLAELGRGI